MKKYFLIMSLLLCTSHIVKAKSGIKKEIPQKIYTTNLLNGNAPDIDGKGDDPVWQQVEWAGDFIQREPNEDSVPSQKTAFKILYDENNIYVLIRAFDTQPDKIVTRMARRDDQQGDLASIYFDSYNDKLSSFAFFLSAADVKSDGILNNDGETDFTWEPVCMQRALLIKKVGQQKCQSL